MALCFARGWRGVLEENGGTLTLLAPALLHSVQPWEVAIPEDVVPDTGLPVTLLLGTRAFVAKDLRQARLLGRAGAGWYRTTQEMWGEVD